MQVDWLRARRWHVRTWFNYFKLTASGDTRYQRLISRRGESVAPALRDKTASTLLSRVWYNLSVKIKGRGGLRNNADATNAQAAYELIVPRLRRRELLQPSANRIFLAEYGFSVARFYDAPLKCSSLSSTLQYQPYSPPPLPLRRSSFRLEVRGVYFEKWVRSQIFRDVQRIRPVRMRVNCACKVSRLCPPSTETRQPRDRDYHYSSSRFSLSRAPDRFCSRVSKKKWSPSRFSSLVDRDRAFGVKSGPDQASEHE